MREGPQCRLEERPADGVEDNLRSLTSGKYIPREVAFAKLKALADGTAIVRRELTGG